MDGSFLIIWAEESDKISINPASGHCNRLL
ncbi:hypothetical protein ACUY4R_000286 [Kosakonia sp. BK9b]